MLNVEFPVLLGYANKKEGVGGPHNYPKTFAWMLANGYSPYYPQHLHITSTNISLQYDCENDGLTWAPEVVETVSRYLRPEVFHNGGYFIGSNPNSQPGALRWCGTSQDNLSVEEMAEYLRHTREWLENNGVDRPMMSLDEPPHAEKFGWSAALEARVLKFVHACALAEFDLGVIFPGKWQLAHWYPKMVDLGCKRFVIGCDKFEWADYEAYCPFPLDRENIEWWVYNWGFGNKTEPPPDEGGRTLLDVFMDFRVKGYLHWSVCDKHAPLLRFDATDKMHETPHAATLRATVDDYKVIMQLPPPVDPEPPIEPVPPPDAELEERVAYLEQVTKAQQTQIDDLNGTLLAMADLIQNNLAPTQSRR